ncbi:hypothetical protein [Isachenkonia alkalipeptolytica]|uniref:Uncharacterized protein n=1 Tax=Isachenkonia alkalipeptolytica TaxID=2565777 RepID=A0AA43XKX4_9CLOT|nr:hypothetical protein [Isachenkonia alkalipeptolytica]NBG88159.1 hypothetical protein [Isachenkonia alkalipeptolytica]
MKQFFYNWNLLKHAVSCFIIWIIIVGISNSLNEPSSMGIIGGAEGLTDIYISGGVYPYLLSVAVLITALAFYVPVKKMFKRALKSND